MMKKIGAIVAVFMVMLGVAVFASSSANAADDVIGVSSKTYTTEVSNVGQVVVKIRFDDTNCTPNTTSNCSGANGAKAVWLDVVSDHGTLPLATDLFIDTWGDGQACANQLVKVTATRVSNTHIHISALPSNLTHVRGIFVGVDNVSSPSWYLSGMVNPFGYNPDISLVRC